MNNSESEGEELSFFKQRKTIVEQIRDSTTIKEISSYEDEIFIRIRTSPSAFLRSTLSTPDLLIYKGMEGRIETSKCYTLTITGDESPIEENTNGEGLRIPKPPENNEKSEKTRSDPDDDRTEEPYEEIHLKARMKVAREQVEARDHREKIISQRIQDEKKYNLK